MKKKRKEKLFDFLEQNKTMKQVPIKTQKINQDFKNHNFYFHITSHHITKNLNEIKQNYFSKRYKNEFLFCIIFLT
jgi:hypothetical protein